MHQFKKLHTEGKTTDDATGLKFTVNNQHTCSSTKLVCVHYLDKSIKYAKKIWLPPVYWGIFMGTTLSF